MRRWMVQPLNVLTFQRSTFFILSLLLAGAMGCSDEPDPMLGGAELVRDGWKAYAAEDYALALLNFERAASQAPTLADAHNGLGWSRLGQSQEFSLNPHLVDQAIEAFQAALRQDTGHADAWVGIANALFLRRKTTRDFVQAVEALDRALAMSDSPWLYRHDYRSRADLTALIAQCYFYLGDQDSASRLVQQVLEEEPQHGTALALKRLMGENTF